MVDIRDQVEDDRGLLKKIQLVIPGFRGYRKREDIRAADSILRLQMADGLIQVRQGLEEARSSMLEEYQSKNIDRIAGAINHVQTLEGKVRHAEQGYTGFSPAVRIEEGELDRLYEYDASMIRSIQSLDGSQASLLNLVRSGDENGATEALRAMKDELVNFERAFDNRIPLISGIYNL
jgi:hypothetical protein